MQKKGLQGLFLVSLPAIDPSTKYFTHIPEIRSFRISEKSIAQAEDPYTHKISAGKNCTLDVIACPQEALL